MIEELIKVGDTHQAQMKRIKQEAAETNKTLQRLNATTVAQRTEIGKQATKTDDLTRAYDRHKQALTENAQEIAAVKQATKELNAINRLEAKLNAAKEGSYNRLSAQYSLLKIRINKLSAEERKNTVEGRRMVKQSKAIFDQMKDLQAQTGKTALNVGNYSEAIKEAIDATGGLGTAFRTLARNPLLAVVSLLVAGLGSLFAAFKKSETGARIFAQIGGIVQGIVSTLVGLVDRFAKGAIKAFEDPKQAMIDFGRFLINQVVNRIMGLVETVGAAGKALLALWNRDMKSLREAGEQAFAAVKKSITGLNEEDQEKFFKAVQETTKAVRENADAFAQLAAARRNVARANRSLARQIEDIAVQETRLNAIAGDSTRSFQEIADANEKARKATEERGKLEIQVARNNISLLNREISLRRANGEEISDLLNNQVEAYKALRGAERELLEATLRNEQERRQIVQDRLERDLDIQIDGFDNAKKIAEAQLKNEELSFEARRSILQRTEAEFERSFAAQIATIQKFTDVQLDANDLVQTSDAVTLNEKIRALGLSEIIEGRILEVVRERRIATQDLITAEKDLAKAEEAAAQAAIRAAEAERRQKIELATEEQEQRAELKKSEFELVKRTEAEKTVFQLQAERDRLQSVLEINKEFGGDLSELQIQTLKNNIQRIDGELEALASGGGTKSIFDLFGLSVNDEQRETIKEAFDFAKKQLSDYVNERARLTQQIVNQSNQAVAAAQRQLEIEQTNAQAGGAARIEAAKQELEAAKANQREALREQQKAQRQQQLIQTLEQSGNLLTMVSKVYAQFGFPLGTIFAASLLGAFATARLKIANLTKRQLGDGDYIPIQGPAHSAGGNVFIGNHNGQSLYAEGKEGMAIFNKRATRHYGPSLAQWVQDINDRNFSPSMEMASAGGSVFVNSQTVNTDMRRTEGHLYNIERNTAHRETVDKTGARRVSRGRHTTIYR